MGGGGMEVGGWREMIGEEREEGEEEEE